MLIIKYGSALAFAFVLALPACTQAKAKAGAGKAVPIAAVTPSPEAQALMKFSRSGHDAVQDIRGARVAIFEGDPTLAKQLMAKASAAVAAAEKEAPTFANTTTMSVEGKVIASEAGTHKAEVVPVDGQVVLADNFVLTPEKKAHIDRANEHFQKGASKEAVDELRQGEIDVNYSRVWMPLPASEKKLAQAIKLANDGKYYEANLTLKSIEDGLTVDSVTLAVPSAKK